MFKISINQKDLERLNVDSSRLSNIRSILSESIIYMERSTRENFLRETSPDGVPWQRLNSKTIERKKTRSILRETLSMINGIFSRVYETEAIIESPVRYSIYHQLGTKNMPKREFLGFGNSDISEIREIFNREINKILDK